MPIQDMTHSYLRAMSPIHLVYLRNMGVRSSMSIVSQVPLFHLGILLKVLMTSSPSWLSEVCGA